MVLTGVDVIGLDGKEREHLMGQRLGLSTNPTGGAKNLRQTIDVLYKDFRLVALFSPEHGLRGEVGCSGYP